MEFFKWFNVSHIPNHNIFFQYIHDLFESFFRDWSRMNVHVTTWTTRNVFYFYVLRVFESFLRDWSRTNVHVTTWTTWNLLYFYVLRNWFTDIESYLPTKKSAFRLIKNIATAPNNPDQKYIYIYSDQNLWKSHGVMAYNTYYYLLKLFFFDSLRPIGEASHLFNNKPNMVLRHNIQRSYVKCQFKIKGLFESWLPKSLVDI